MPKTILAIALLVSTAVSAQISQSLEVVSERNLLLFRTEHNSLLYRLRFRNNAIEMGVTAGAGVGQVDFWYDSLIPPYARGKASALLYGAGRLYHGMAHLPPIGSLHGPVLH